MGQFGVRHGQVVAAVGGMENGVHEARGSECTAGDAAVPLSMQGAVGVADVAGGVEAADGDGEQPLAPYEVGEGALHCYSREVVDDPGM